MHVRCGGWCSHRIICRVVGAEDITRRPLFSFACVRLYRSSESEEAPMSDPYSYRTIEEFADAFENVRKQVRVMKWLFGFMAVAFIASIAALLYFAQDFSRNASVLDSRARSLERQGSQ